MEGLARARRDVMRRRRQERLDDALAARAVDESAVDETEAGGAGTAERLAHPGVCAKGVGEFRVYSTLTTANRLSWPYKPCLASSVCKGDGVVSQRGWVRRSGDWVSHRACVPLGMSRVLTKTTLGCFWPG